MVDHVSIEKRSEIMKKILGKNTAPELVVRKLVFALGYRYRLHSKKLPGKPDLVFPSKKKAIFVHGCFWHYHQCKKGKLPKSKLDYWKPKLEANRERDSRTKAALEFMGWKTLVIWQCEISDRESLTKKIVEFLGRENGI